MASICCASCDTIRMFALSHLKSFLSPGRLSYVPIKYLPWICEDEPVMILFPNLVLDCSSRYKLLSPSVGWWLNAVPEGVHPANVPVSKSHVDVVIAADDGAPTIMVTPSTAMDDPNESPL